jgi:hypothetical protein
MAMSLKPLARAGAVTVFFFALLAVSPAPASATPGLCFTGKAGTSYSVGTYSYTNGEYGYGTCSLRMVYGDGTSDWKDVGCSDGSSFYFTHTWSSPGTYTLYADNGFYTPSEYWVSTNDNHVGPYAATLITPDLRPTGGSHQEPMCSVQICASNYGASCSHTSSANACGQTNTSYGTYGCDGSCSVGTPSPPANPGNYG